LRVLVIGGDLIAYGADVFDLAATRRVRRPYLAACPV
jgi:hypothetical protein